MGLGFLRIHVKDGEFWSGFPVPEPQCRDLGFGIDSLANGLGRFRNVLESLIDLCSRLMSSMSRRLPL
ncbi:hypothetical protein NC651_022842 [Populus alba x Populus x berolinensis]|nr:hypothetical protein NC651_022842 [Populus alba x Populus x berolinensis]